MSPFWIGFRRGFVLGAMVLSLPFVVLAHVMGWTTLEIEGGVLFVLSWGGYCWQVERGRRGDRRDG